MTARVEGQGGARRPRLVAALVIAAALAVFAGANAHLVYVSIATQPDCVPHNTRPDGSPAAFRAAKPVC